MKKNKESFSSLTWDDLRQWAGGKILSRGKSYVKNVSDLARTENGEWAAWVSGTKDYATCVAIDSDGEIDWNCTCPFDWGPCKHAVAVILAGIEYVKADKEIPLLDDASDLSLQFFTEPDEDGDCFYDDGDEFDDLEPGSTDGSFENKVKSSALTKILRKKKKEELLILLVDFAHCYPEVRRRIMEDDQLATGQVDKLADALRREIREVSSENAWCNHWNDEGNLPDYSHIQKQMAALLKKGHADVVVELGRELWTSGNEQVGQSHDDGCTAGEISECMEIVFAAVCSSSLPASEQLLWMINIALEDQYSMGNSVAGFIRRKKYTKEHWLEVSANLRQRLTTLPKRKVDDFSTRYDRERLMNWLIRAFEESGQPEKIIPLLEDEVSATQCYDRLVNAYIDSGHIEKARECCVKGFTETISDAPGIAVGLRKKLRELAVTEKRFDLVAAYWAEEFFDSPDRASYQKLQKAAEKIKAWSEVRAAVLSFLENGNRPLPSNKAVKRKWPLPAPEVKQKSAKLRHNHYPDLNALIDIAILEKRHDDVVQLYQQRQKTQHWGFGKGEEVAAAVAETHPDTALAIWKQLAISRIKMVKPKEYEVAAGYLRKMHKVYQKTKRLEEWQQLILSLRSEHKPKRRLMEVLDSLEGRRIID